MDVTTISVPLGQRSYHVCIAPAGATDMAQKIAAALGKPTGVAVLVDSRLGQLSPRVQPLVEALAACLPRVRRLDLPAGESCKTLAAIERTCDWLADNGYDRGAALVGIGGGATSDHTGFAAAIYLRGIVYATCPTTLLAMVDASVGGKTGVDIAAGKNLVGAFYQPRAVMADPGFLDSLPSREFAAGMTEVVKAGLIADAALLDTLEAQAGAAMPAAVLAKIIEAAVRVKVEVVAADERESGRRAVLNFGHTVGHAIEAASGFQLLHGEAVSLGMIAALALGIARGVTEPGLLGRVTALLARLGLPVDVKHQLSADVLARMEVDKKRRSDAVRFVLVPRPGQAVIEGIALDELKRELLAAV
jgi:shikimate kinase / 3-dehydroquinate synthase